MKIASGFLLVRSDPTSSYRGVDREPFAPEIRSEDLRNHDSAGDLAGGRGFPSLVSDDWRRRAYESFELDSSTDESGSLTMLNHLEVARRLREEIEPHVGPLEVLECVVYRPPLEPSSVEIVGAGGLGLDVAYPGGDFYSAIRNGLFLNASELLTELYSRRLNRNGLFDRVEDCLEYLVDFRQAVASESESEFVIYSIKSPLD